MDATDVLLATVRWIHGLAAVVWVGGSIFYLFALQPALNLPAALRARPILESSVNGAFRDLVDISIIALIITGVVITFDRLSSLPITTAYYVVLGLKLVIVAAMLFLARDLGTRMGRRLRPVDTTNKRSEPSLSQVPFGTRGWRRLLSPSRLILVAGVVAIFLSMLLVHVYESDVAGIA